MRKRVDTLYSETDFPTAKQKEERVREVFADVATNYDLMNDLMTAGVHRLWKSMAIEVAAIRADHQVLDIACGTMDLTIEAAKRARQGRVTALDPSQEMLEQGRLRLFDAGMHERVDVVQAAAEQLPFNDNSFDTVIVGFGLRNFSDRGKALSEIYRVLKPSGIFVCLELSRPENHLLRTAYDQISARFLPALASLVTRNSESYQYLHDSIRHHPTQSELLAQLRGAHFSDAHYHNLAAGIAAIHYGRKK